MLLLLTIITLNAQMSNLGGRLVSRSEYEDALPFCNTERLRVRSLPNIEWGSISGYLNTGDLVNIHNATIEKFELNGEMYPWYRINKRHGENISGWVYGKYISFKDDYAETFWLDNGSIQKIDSKSLNPIILRKQILHKYLNLSNDFVPSSWIQNKECISETAMTAEIYSSCTLREYSTVFGTIQILYQEGNSRFDIAKIIINSFDSSDLIVSMNDNIDIIKSTFGKQYTEKQDEISFWIDPMYDVYLLTFKFNDNIIDTIEIELIFGAL